jgi:hypothetical protein
MSVMDKYHEDQIIEVDVREFVEVIWNSVSKKISNDWLHNMESPLAADIALLKLSKIVSIATTAYDGVVEGNTPLELLTPDGEPLPVSIDPWARGTGKYFLGFCVFILTFICYNAM